MESKQAIGRLFDPAHIRFTIPIYQRAFSWGEKEIGEFWQDIVEHHRNWPENNGASHRNPYYLGNILLACQDDKEEAFDVIDGQQRLSTLVILFACIVHVLKKRGYDAEWLADTRERYLERKGKVKFQTVKYDNNFFLDTIIEDKDGGKVTTASMQRILKAKCFFTTQLEALPSDEMRALADLLGAALVTIYPVDSKQQAAQIFIFQNDRGKSLTELEKLKAWFVYAVQMRSDNSDGDLAYLESIFTVIYESIEHISRFAGVTEDDVLAYYARAFYFGYDGFSRKRVIEEVEKIEDKQGKIEWIKEFSTGLREAFKNMVLILSSRDPVLADLRYLKRMALCYPFLLKVFACVPDEQEAQRRQVFQLLEIIVVRVVLLNSRARVESRLNPHLQQFAGDVPALVEAVRQDLRHHGGWNAYWGDELVKNALNANNFYNNDLKNYVLWKYEEHLREVRGPKGYATSVPFEQVNMEELEHIAPQTPTDGEPVAAGYAAYTEEFLANLLNCIGNLMLISKSHNCSLSNRPFSQKLASYRNNTALSQHLEIEEFVKDASNPCWDGESIEARRKKIVAFAIKRLIG